MGVVWSLAIRIEWYPRGTGLLYMFRMIKKTAKFLWISHFHQKLIQMLQLIKELLLLLGCQSFDSLGEMDSLR